MSRLKKELPVIVFISFLMIDLALRYDTYKYCSKPIHHWMMALLIGVLVHRFLDCCSCCVLSEQNANIFLIYFLGSLTFLSIFVWNVVGSVFLGFISVSSNRLKCMTTFSLVLFWGFIVIVYFVYALLILYAWKYYISQRNIQKQKEKAKINLNKIYSKLLKPLHDLKKIEIQELVTNINFLQTTKKYKLEKIPLFDKEHKIIRLFYKTSFTADPRIHDQNFFKIEPQNVLENDPGLNANDLTEPLLKMIGRDTQKDKMEKRITRIQENANEDSDCCIICLVELEDTDTLVLKCRHKYHESCLFEWLRQNPLCPMCRRNFRIDLLNHIKDQVNQVLAERMV